MKIKCNTGLQLKMLDGTNCPRQCVIQNTLLGIEGVLVLFSNNV